MRGGLTLTPIIADGHVDLAWFGGLLRWLARPTMALAVRKRRFATAMTDGLSFLEFGNTKAKDELQAIIQELEEEKLR